MKNETNLSICTCGKKIDYVKTRKPNGRMGVIVLHVEDEPYPADGTIPEVSDEYKKWLRDLCHQTTATEKPVVPKQKQQTEIITTPLPETEPEVDNSAKPNNNDNKKFSVVSKFLNQGFDDIDNAMEIILEKIPTADFSFWNESTEATWIDVFASSDDHTVVGKIFDGDN